MLDDISIFNLHKNDSAEIAAVSDQPTCTKEKCSINRGNLIDEPPVITVVKLNANISSEVHHLVTSSDFRTRLILNELDAPNESE